MSAKETKMKESASKKETESHASQEKAVSQQLTAKESRKEVSHSQKYPKNTVLILQVPIKSLDCKQKLEREKQENLIGQLKAAESHNKIQNMRLRYQTMRAEEINHLISSQPTARKAIRLEALLPPHQEYINLKDTLDKLERRRVEEIMSDETGLTINRLL
ncbi:protein LKAAEAR1-like [Heptranchias perlo]|uniref:protein LKAAEAR1-like n=1 Tax=Heptranchias perlo TaxID=212740 RepID=UPI00355976C1